MKLDMKILVVDDFSTMRRIIRNVLGEIGLTNVDEADDGITAQPKLEEGAFELLVLDWNMPRMTGIELLRWVRSKPALAELPVLMVTAEAKREQIVEAAQAGVSGYIVKPFTADTLRTKLDRIFARAA